jgi:hypothetical protein
VSIGIDVTPLPELGDYLRADVALMALATGSVWEDPSPDHIDDLVVIVGLQSGLDETLCADDRVTEFFLAVKAVGPAATINSIRLAGKRIDDLMLNNLPGNGLGAYHVLLVERSQPVAYNDPEPSTGIRYEHRGGIYRLLVGTR